MAKQTIGIGTTANDGTGDSLRVAFGKINSNFTETYNYDGYLANTLNIVNSVANYRDANAAANITAAFNKANSAYSYAVQIDDDIGYAYNNSNTAFNFANGTVLNTTASFSHANSSYGLANSLSIQINTTSGGLREKDNIIYTFANTIYNHTNVTYNRANVIYNFANVVQIRTNASFVHVNAAFLQANTGRTHANNAFDQANVAYSYGISLNTSKLANTDSISFAGSLYFPLGKLVGIGINSPLAPLHVRNTTANPIAVFHSEGTQDLSLRFRRGANYEWSITNENASKDLVFSYGASTNIFRVTNEGNVGVGITPSTYKFDVNGNSYFRDTAAFASFVTVAIGAGQTNQKGIYSLNPDGIGIHGKVTRGVGGVDGSIGVLGEAVNGTGVKGVATTGTGVVAISTSGSATYSVSTSGYGVYGISSSSYGVRGQSATSYGVFGISTSQAGVYGSSTNGGIGVYGISPNNYGGAFDSTSGPALLGRSVSNIGITAASDSNWSILAGTFSSARFGVNPSGVIHSWNGNSLRPAYACRAWVQFNQNGTIRASAGVTSISKLNTGFYRINFAYAMPTAFYSVCGTTGMIDQSPTSYWTKYAGIPLTVASHRTTYVDITTYLLGTSNRDRDYNSVAIFC